MFIDQVTIFTSFITFSSNVEVCFSISVDRIWRSLRNIPTFLFLFPVRDVIEATIWLVRVWLLVQSYGLLQMW